MRGPPQRTQQTAGLVEDRVNGRDAAATAQNGAQQIHAFTEKETARLWREGRLERVGRLQREREMASTEKEALKERG